MKRTMGFFLFLLALSLNSYAQDLSSFYQISGFQLPPLRAGQYALTISPRYRSSPSDNTQSSTSSSNSLVQSTFEGSAHSSSYLFTVGSSFMYGLSDQTTISLALQLSPGQSSGDNVSDGNYSATSSFGYQSHNLSSYREDSFSSSLIFAHRFQSNIEFSLLASYRNANLPGTSFGTTTQSGGSLDNSLASSSSKSRNFDIQASIVILGN